MEQATLQKIARLRRLAGQQGKPFDVMRFAAETDYARSTLHTLLDTDDEDMLITGMSLMNDLFSAPASAPLAPSPPAPVSAVAPSTSNRYIGRLR